MGVTVADVHRGPPKGISIVMAEEHGGAGGREDDGEPSWTPSCEDEEDQDEPDEGEPPPAEAEGQPQPQEGEMTPEEAERLLDAIEEDPEDVNRKPASALGRKPKKPW